MKQSDIRHFFRTVQERSLFLNNCIFGNIDFLTKKMQERTGEELNYPLLMIDVISSTSDLGHKKFKIHALIGSQADRNDIEVAEQVMDTCDQESDNFRGYIERNFRSINGELDFKFTNKYPYLSATGDNIYGWIWDIDVTSKFECDFTKSFNMAPSSITPAAFIWTKSGNNIVISGLPSGATNEVSVKSIGMGDYAVAPGAIEINEYYQVILLKTTVAAVDNYAYALIFPNERRVSGEGVNLGKNSVI